MSFSPEVVAAVARHMNDDHAADCVVICRALGGQPETTVATMSGMDGDAVYFDATVEGATVLVRVPFSQTLTERAQVRVEITQLYHEAAALLGLTNDEHIGQPNGEHA